MKIKGLFFSGLLFSSMSQAQGEDAFFPLSQYYSQCQMTLLEDQSVQISFTVNLKKGVFDVKNLNKTKEREKNAG